MIKSFFHTEFFRYVLASSGAFALDLSGLYFFTEYAHFHYLISAALSFLLGMFFIYILSIHWIFDERTFDQKRIELPLFILIGVVGLLINQLGIYVVTEYMGLYYLFSKLAVTVLVFGWNFGARKIMLFTNKNDQ